MIWILLLIPSAVIAQERSLYSVPILESEGKPLLHTVITELKFKDCCLNCDAEPLSNKFAAKFYEGYLKVGKTTKEKYLADPRKMYLDRIYVGGKVLYVMLTDGGTKEHLFPFIVNEDELEYFAPGSAESRWLPLESYYVQTFRHKVKPTRCDSSIRNFGFQDIIPVCIGSPSNSYLATDALVRLDPALPLVEPNTVAKYPFLEAISESYTSNKRELVKYVPSFRATLELFPILEKIKKLDPYLLGIIPAKNANIVFIGKKDLSTVYVLFFLKDGDTWKVSHKGHHEYYGRDPDDFAIFSLDLANLLIPLMQKTP